MSRTNPIAEPGRPSPGAGDLDPEVQQRLEHAGRWVAWTLDGARIVASGETPEAAHAAASQAGIDRFILDWIPPIDERHAGL